MANPKPILQQPLAPPARRATARRRDRRRGPSGLTPAWPGSRCVLASPDARSRRSRRPARAPPDPSASTAARTRAALSAPLSPFTRAVHPWADASSRPAGEPPRARRRRPQLLQRPLMASRAFPGRPGDRRWAAVHRRGSHARLATPCAIRDVVLVVLVVLGDVLGGRCRSRSPAGCRPPRWRREAGRASVCAWRRRSPACPCALRRWCSVLRVWPVRARKQAKRC